MDRAKSQPEPKIGKSQPSRAITKRKQRGRPKRRKIKLKASQEKSLARKNCHVVAFRYRNVFKCILRNMHAYTQEREKELIEVLKEECYSTIEIMRAFEEIRLLKPKEFPTEILRKSKMKVEAILRRRTPKTYILRATLKFMLEKLHDPKYHQVLPDNKQIYIEACRAYMLVANKTINRQYYSTNLC